MPEKAQFPRSQWPVIASHLSERLSLACWQRHGTRVWSNPPPYCCSVVPPSLRGAQHRPTSRTAGVNVGEKLGHRFMTIHVV
eukprot:g12376.t1